jgi:hypothetical protein
VRRVERDQFECAVAERQRSEVHQLIRINAQRALPVSPAVRPIRDGDRFGTPIAIEHVRVIADKPPHATAAAGVENWLGTSHPLHLTGLAWSARVR